LPNIIGQKGIWCGFPAESPTGAFSYGNSKLTYGSVSSGNAETMADKFTFNASLYNSIYSDSVASVQPASYQTLIIIKA
jgi:hypothetical protein